VEAHIVLTEPEQVIYQNVLAKEREAERTGRELVRHVAAFEQAELGQVERSQRYEAGETMSLPAWMGQDA
jgi:hypothetical protein